MEERFQQVCGRSSRDVRKGGTAQRQSPTSGDIFKEGGGWGWGIVLKMSICCKSVSRTIKPTPTAAK